MERAFVQSALFGSVILIVYVLVSPAFAFSAQQHAMMLNPKDHVRRGTVTSIDKVNKNLLVDFAGVSIAVTIDASTTISSPEGDDADLSVLENGAAIYVFGDYASSTESIQARKIIVRKPSIMTRDSFSQAQLNGLSGVMVAKPSASTTFTIFNLTAR